MTNNDILRRVRYIFDLSDSNMIAIFGMADYTVTREQVSDWLKKEEDPAYKSCPDVQMATFLNGFINLKRGKRDGEQPIPETRLTNNIIFKKLTIALNIRSEEILAILELADFVLSKHELSAFFRKPDNKHFRECKDQVLRNFLQGLQLKLREQLELEPALETNTEAKTALAPKPTTAAEPKPIADTKSGSKTKWKKSASTWSKN